MSISVTTRRMSAPVLTSRRSPQGACLLLLVCTFACLLIGCSGSGDRMRQQLQQLQARNQSDSLLTDDSLATALCAWFDSYGTPNERMLAHYLMGRTWADKGEAPQALEEYHTAAECADTIAADCDYGILTRIHAQSANLFYEQQMPNEMLEELGLMEKFALQEQDTISWLLAIEWQHVAYNLLGDYSKAKAVLTKAYHDFLTSGYSNMALNCLPALVDYSIKICDLKSAKSFIDLYESDTLAYNNENVKPGREIYYYFKGCYFIAINNVDSAKYYFQKLKSKALTANDKEAALKGLYEAYKVEGNFDSVAKYADLCYLVSEERYRNYNVQELQRLQSLYNYSRHKSLAQQKTIDAQRSKQRIYTLSGIFSVILIVIISLLIYFKRRKKEEIRKKEEEYRHNIEVLEQAKADIINMKEQNYDAMLHQKELEIEKREQTIERLKTSMSPEKALDIQLANTTIYKRFIYLIEHPIDRPTDQDWKQLEETFEKLFPQLRSFMNVYSRLNTEDYRICMLTRLHFSPSEISTLTNITLQNLGMKRKRLLRKLFKQEGGANDFNRRILTFGIHKSY